MKKLAVIVVLFVFALLAYSAPAQAQEKIGRPEPGPVTANFIGIGGMVFQPGQNVEVNWILQGDGVKYFESNTWGECELMFSADGGRTWTRVTPQMSVTRRKYDWTVPNVSTKEAVIGLRIGIEGEGEFYLFPSEPFSVLTGRLAPSVDMVAVKAEGNTIEMKWKSNVRDVVDYEVLVSSDRGAHFFSVGKTQSRYFSFVVPDDYDGALTFQIVARRPDGAKVKSLLIEDSTINIRNLEK